MVNNEVLSCQNMANYYSIFRQLTRNNDGYVLTCTVEEKSVSYNRKLKLPLFVSHLVRGYAIQEQYFKFILDG